MKYLVKSPVRFNKKRLAEGAVIELDDAEAEPLVAEGILQRQGKPEQKPEGK